MKASNLSQLVDRALAGGSSLEDPAEVCRQLAGCNDRRILRRTTNGSQKRVRVAAIRRNTVLEPAEGAHYLELYRHFQNLGLQEAANSTLDQAEVAVPDDVSIMRCRMALHSGDDPVELLKRAKAYLPRFGSDPFLGIVILRCEQVVESARRAASGISDQSVREAGETGTPVILPRPNPRDPHLEESHTPVEWLISIPNSGAATVDADPRIAHIMAAMQRKPVIQPRPRKPQPRRVVLPVEGPPPLDER